MDTPLMKKVESIVNYTKSLEHRLHESQEFVCQMKDDFKFPTMEYIRLTIDNVNIQPTIVIAVKRLGINDVKPSALFAKPFAAVPKITANISTM